MPATRDGKLWRSQFYYKDWQGVRRKKNKRGFKTKGEADEWERNFLQQQQKNLDISFENFVEIYFADMENRLRESTIINKRYVFDLKVTPYFKHKKMCEIQTSDIRAWQNELIKKGYAPTYLKSINNQLAALFNYAVRYYDLRDNPFIGWAIMKLRQTNCWEESPRKQIKRSGQNNSFMNWQKQTAW